MHLSCCAGFVTTAQMSGTMGCCASSRAGGECALTESGCCWAAGFAHRQRAAAVESIGLLLAWSAAAGLQPPWCFAAGAARASNGAQRGGGDARMRGGAGRWGGEEAEGAERGRDAGPAARSAAFPRRQRSPAPRRAPPLGRRAGRERAVGGRAASRGGARRQRRGRGNRGRGSVGPAVREEAGGPPPPPPPAFVSAGLGGRGGGS